jgi:hypothetical protein
VEPEASTYPRVSKKVSHGLEIVLTVIWLGGTAFFLDVLDTGWLGPIILLAFVVVIETAFVVWNEGHLSKAKKAERANAK